MGIEFMSDARKLQQAGSSGDDRTPRGFVAPLVLGSQPQQPPASASREDVPPVLTTRPVTRVTNTL